MEKIVEKLDNINKTLENILHTLNKPENGVTRVLGIIGFGVGMLSILNAADIIRSWIAGG